MTAAQQISKLPNYLETTTKILSPLRDLTLQFSQYQKHFLHWFQKNSYFLACISALPASHFYKSDIYFRQMENVIKCTSHQTHIAFKVCPLCPVITSQNACPTDSLFAFLIPVFVILHQSFDSVPLLRLVTSAHPSSLSIQPPTRSSIPPPLHSLWFN